MAAEPGSAGRATTTTGWLSRQKGSVPSATVVALTLVTGAVDAISFMVLGGVFTSVMTANLALLGLAVGSDDLTLAGHVVVALAGYVCGILGGAWCGIRPAREKPFRWDGARTALAGELLLVCGFLGGWIAVGGTPGMAAQLGLLATASLAMGCQSGLIRVAGARDVSTTYLTGTLTGILAELVTTGRLQRSNIVLIGVLPVGAALSGALVTWARPFAPVLPAALLAATLALSFAPANGRGPTAP
ncbi:YoaK family protein [Streptomyces sp. AK02-01A]|uniref:YoaK family protein n=1 Tax=Streptomyces sp. AK02-01A TaxID=3028648 RepID=UPI0029B6BB91|nr:YoaK family protein [Streptomyces sp. AK02-01A]MDX3854327.1 YoaK family protein [Streptomyces sp. AK02-01A]